MEPAQNHKVAKIHHKNQVFSMKGITNSSANAHKQRIPSVRLITTTKVAWRPVSGDYTI